MPKTIHGHCACASITYTIQPHPLPLPLTLPLEITNCYCTTCQPYSPSPSTHPFVGWIDIPNPSLHLQDKDGRLQVLRSEVVERKVCGRCGAAVTMRYFCDRSTGVAVETVDQESLAQYVAEMGGKGDGKGKAEMMKVKEHIFVGQKPDWYRIPEGDGARQWDRFRAEFGDVIERWKRKNGVKS